MNVAVCMKSPRVGAAMLQPWMVYIEFPFDCARSLAPPFGMARHPRNSRDLLGNMSNVGGNKMTCARAMPPPLRHANACFDPRVGLQRGNSCEHKLGQYRHGQSGRGPRIKHMYNICSATLQHLRALPARRRSLLRLAWPSVRRGSGWRWFGRRGFPVWPLQGARAPRGRCAARRLHIRRLTSIATMIAPCIG